jgi:hypothetical protein
MLITEKANTHQDNLVKAKDALGLEHTASCFLLFVEVDLDSIPSSKDCIDTKLLYGYKMFVSTPVFCTIF